MRTLSDWETLKGNRRQSKPAHELFAEASVFKLVNGRRKEAQL